MATKKTIKKEIDSHTIRVSQAVLDAIAADAKGYRETPDAVLRRKFGLPKKEHWSKR